MTETERPSLREAQQKRLSVFPLTGAVLFPLMQLPLHIFEPRYREMVSAALAGDRLIGMVQPRSLVSSMDVNEVPELFEMGCLGRITDVEALEDGCYNILLEGLTRFHITRELDVKTPFRQVEAMVEIPSEDDFLASAERAALERESRLFADRQGYVVDWNAVTQLDDMAFVNGVAQVAPFDAAAKQALLEANNLSTRAELIMQLLEFFGRRDSDDDTVTLQ